jgi:pseudouridine-5'-phosphate glycosidase
LFQEKTLKSDLFLYSDAVKRALDAKAPIVALESTIITHGMPYPQNVDTARQVEQTVRDAGAVPATIAVMDGKICIGLCDSQLDHLAQSPNVAKLSRADLAVCVAQAGVGATTVAATMICAARAGIHVFATGGIGGVHQGAEESFDISADLQELAQTPVSVVAAGPKAILDIPKTLEVLETLGVPVIAVGQDNVPAFWSRDGGLSAPLRLDHADDIAHSHIMRGALGIPGGQLIVNPIPVDAEIPAHIMAPMIAKAQAMATAQGIATKAVTPFLLQHLFEISQGETLKANIALVLNNARLASEIAVSIAQHKGL